MHELGIANAVLEAVRTEAARYPGTSARKVGVRIGELTAVDEDALRFCFEALTRETDLRGLELQVEICPRRHRCSLCGEEFRVRDYDFRCPACGGEQSSCISGDELEFAYLEVEDDEPRAVGAQSTKRE
jgi:hydrogenase nickel incorporation protein HypA/HybF